MASGRPDWHSIVTISGKYDSTFLPVLLDSSGNLITHLQGYDGSQLRDILVDSSGRIVAFIMGDDSGTPRNIAVDSAGKIITQIQGDDSGTLRTIAVDANGKMVGVIQGDFGGTLKTVAVDTDGQLKVNLFAQDLNFLTVRPAYGEAVRSSGNTAVGAGATVTLVTISGQGVILGGAMWYTHVSAREDMELIIDVDGTEVFDWTVEAMYVRGLIEPTGAPAFVRFYPCETTFDYMVGLQPGFTFETSIAIKWKNTYGDSEVIDWRIWYALTP